jgi:hydrogenase nickel incorporation protein HypA/HybF
MHELQVTQLMLNVVLEHARKNRVQKILTVHLEIGKLKDFEQEWIQQYFDYLSKGTPAEGAKLQIEWIPVTLQCSSCSHSFEVDVKLLTEVRCPECGDKQCSMISGREYRVKQIEVV